MRHGSFMNSHTIDQYTNYRENIFNSSESSGLAILYESLIGRFKTYKSLGGQNTQSIFCRSGYLKNISMQSI